MDFLSLENSRAPTEAPKCSGARSFLAWTGDLLKAIQPSRLNDAQRQAIGLMIENGPISAVHGVVRWRLVDLAQWIFEEFRITIAKQTFSRELRAMGYRKLSARPRHHAQAEGVVEHFKKRMARPVASDFVEYAVIGLLQRIRPRAQAPAKMEIRASRSS